MKFAKYLFCSVIFVFILCHAVPAYAAMTPVTIPFQVSDMVLYDVNHSTSQNLSDYDSSSKVIILGSAVSCLNTDATIKKAEALATGLDASNTTFVFGDIDDNVTNTKSYTNIHNIIMCASPTKNYYLTYMWQNYWKCIAPNNATSMTIPFVMIVDKNGLARYYSNGIVDAKDIFDALKAVNNGNLSYDEDKACTTDIAKANLSKHKLYRTDDIAMSYYKTVYDQQYYNSGVGAGVVNTLTTMVNIPTTMGTSALKLATGNQINASGTVTQEDRVKAIKTLSASIITGKTTDYDKVKAIHDWVCDNIYYDYMYLYGIHTSTNLSAYDVMTNKTTVCEGYANLTTMLVRAAGIPCKKIIGYGQNGKSWPENILINNTINHAWNEAYINGKWIIIDSTWDSGNKYKDNVLSKNPMRNSYFDPFISVFSSDHYVVNYEEGVVENKAPTLAVNSTGSDFVELSWNAVNNAYAYDVYRATAGSDQYEKMNTAYQYTKDSILVYKDKTCSSNTQYRYKVIPYCQAGSTPIYGITSNILTVKTALPMQQITAPSYYIKTFGDVPFSLNASTSGNGTLSYASSDNKIITVDNAGKVSIIGAGTAKVTITASQTPQYLLSTFVVSVYVNKNYQKITAPYNFIKTYGDSAFSLGATVTPGGGTLQYVSDNPSIVTVSSSGLVTIKGCGDAKITITAEANSNYYGTSTYVYISIKKMSQTLSVPSMYYAKTYGDLPFSLGVTRNGDGVLGYSSSNQKVATVDIKGIVKFVGVGSATITVTASETVNYAKATTFVTFKVSKATQRITSKSSYTKIYGDNSFALGATITKGGSKLSYSTSNAAVVTVSPSGQVTIKGCGKAVITITANESENYSKAILLVNITINPKKVKVNSLVSTNAKKLNLSWTADSSSSGYEIMYSTDKNFKSYKSVSVTTNKTTSVVISGLQTGKIYYVKIRAYKTVSGSKLYGEDSIIKNIKVK